MIYTCSVACFTKDAYLCIKLILNKENCAFSYMLRGKNPAWTLQITVASKPLDSFRLKSPVLRKETMFMVLPEYTRRFSFLF